MRTRLFAVCLVLMLAGTLVAPPPARAAASGGSTLLADLIGFTGALSGFFGDAIHGMTDAIGYLTGGIQAAGHFQQGTDIVNDMLQNGPPAPPAPAPAPTPLPGPAAGTAPVPVPVPATEAAGAPVQAVATDDAAFRNHLARYADLSREERKVAGMVKKDPGNPALQGVLGDLRQAKEEHRNKILFALNYDIETKKYDKLHLLIDYLNTSGDQTVKFFLEIIDETKTKLRFQLVQAQNVGIAVDLEIIEGKLALVMKLTGR